jgi:hypothetical protein
MASYAIGLLEVGDDVCIEALQFARVLLVFFPHGSYRLNVKAQKSRSEDDVDGSVGGGPLSKLN